MRIVLLNCILFGTILNSAFSVLAEPLDKLQQDFADATKATLKRHDIPGAAYTIVKGNKVLTTQTFGFTDKHKNQKINEDTVFRLASVSKPFAATVTTMVAHETGLDLSDPVTDYAPHFQLSTKGAAEKIQLQHLLSHSTGLMPNAYDNMLHENWSFDKVVSRFDKLTPLCQPEKCYGYQNVAFALVEPAVEAHTSIPYAQLVEEKIFTPLKMNNASVGFDAFSAQENSAQPHVLIKRVNTGKRDKNGRKIKKNIWRQVSVKPDYYKVAPAAGVNASIKDMSKWLIANLGYQPEVLSSRLLEELTTPRVKTRKDLRRRFWKKHLNDAHYGYGWRIYDFDGMPLIYHSGWVEGYRADIGYAPGLDIGFAILMNAEGNAISEISANFWRAASQLRQEQNSKALLAD